MSEFSFRTFKGVTCGWGEWRQTWPYMPYWEDPAQECRISKMKRTSTDRLTCISWIWKRLRTRIKIYLTSTCYVNLGNFSIPVKKERVAGFLDYMALLIHLDISTHFFILTITENVLISFSIGSTISCPLRSADFINNIEHIMNQKFQARTEQQCRDPDCKYRRVSARTAKLTWLSLIPTQSGI